MTLKIKHNGNWVEPTDVQFFSPDNLPVSSIHIKHNGNWETMYPGTTIPFTNVSSVDLTPPDPEINGLYGHSLRMSGNKMIVSAYSKDVAGGDSDPVADVGAAYVYNTADNGATWNFEGYFVPLGNPYLSYYGMWDIAIEGNYIAVGAHGYQNANGAVYCYFYNGSQWNYTQTIVPDVIIDNFGISVSISGGWMAVGATSSDEDGNNAGKVFIYQNVAGNWQLHQTAIPADIQAESYSGYPVHMEGELLLFGSSGYNSLQGRVYVYKRNGTTYYSHPSINPPVSIPNARFGWAFDYDSVTGTLAIGAYDESITGTKEGAVYLYKTYNQGEEWIYNTKIVPSDGGDYHNFGTKIRIDNGILMIGQTSHYTSNTTNKGAVYVYEHDGNDNWNFATKIEDTSVTTTDAFGRGMDFVNGMLAVGIPGYLSGSGKVRVYKEN